jgi:hypothetical protein
LTLYDEVYMPEEGWRDLLIECIRTMLRCYT